MGKVLLAHGQPAHEVSLLPHLQGIGLDVLPARSSEDCLRLHRQEQPDLAIIATQPWNDGWIPLTRALRSGDGGLGIIILAGRADPVDHVAALDNGADCFLLADTHPHVLLSQARRLLQRCQTASGSPLQEVRVGRYQVNLLLRRITAGDGRSIALTAGEFALLAGLVKHRGQPVSRDDLLAFLRPMGDAYACGDLRTIDTLIGRLRKKLDGGYGRSNLIQTIYGKGYRLVSQDETPSVPLHR